MKFATIALLVSLTSATRLLREAPSTSAGDAFADVNGSPYNTHELAEQKAELENSKKQMQQNAQQKAQKKGVPLGKKVHEAMEEAKLEEELADSNAAEEAMDAAFEKNVKVRNDYNKKTYPSFTIVHSTSTD